MCLFLLCLSQDINKELVAFLSQEDGQEPPEENQAEDPPSKKLKLEQAQAQAEPDGSTETAGVAPEICVACLGVLQDFCDQSYAKQVLQKPEGLCGGCVPTAHSCLLTLLHVSDRQDCRGGGHCSAASHPLCVCASSVVLTLGKEIRNRK